MKKILTLMILVVSCIKGFNDLEIKNKDINDDLLLAIINNDELKTIELLGKGADINNCSNKSILNIAIDKAIAILELKARTKFKAMINLPFIKILIKKGVDLSKENIIKIYDLALDNFDHEIIDLIKDKYKLEEGLIDKNKYFLLLCYISNAEEVKKFMQNNNINQKEIKDNINRNALIIACISGRKDIVKLLLESYELDIKYKDDCGVTPLIAALNINLSNELLKLLIDKGANVNDKDNNSRTALMYASEEYHKEAVELLIEKGANVNDKDNKGLTALMYALRYGHKEVVELLIEKGANINDKDKYGLTALMYASRYGHKEVVELLIEKGANINDKDNIGWTALICASGNGHKEVVKLLIEKGANIDEKDKYGWKALILSSQNGHKEVIELLIEKGANVNDKDKYNRTALDIASSKGYKEIVELLIEKEANVNDKDDVGLTALMYASEECHKEVIELLIEKGANVNDKDKYNRTALDIASSKGYKEIVELLIEKEANVNDKDDVGLTALMYASQNGHTEVAELLIEKGANVNDKDESGLTALMYASEECHKEVIELLIEKGANVNDKDKYNRTALDIASSKGYKEIVELLIEKEANVNDKDNKGRTALMNSSLRGHKEIVGLLIEKGANVNDKDNIGWTALMNSSLGGHKEIVGLLIEKGANVNDKCNAGLTALMYAAKRGHKEIVESLIEKGANINDKDNYHRNTALIYASEECHKEIVRLLIEKGANVNDKDNYNRTALDIASSKGYKEIIKLLIEKGTNIGNIEYGLLENILIENIKNNIENSLLIIYKYKNRIDFGYKDKEGNTLLHYTALANSLPLFIVLFSEGKDLNLLNNRGESPLYYALSSNNFNQDFIWYLINNGASLKPTSYIKDKLLLDILLSYEGLCNKLVYEPLTLKLLGNINLNFKDKNKMKEIIKTLKIKEDDFNDKEAMIKFIQDIFKVKYNNNLDICDISTLIINNDMRDVDLNVDVFMTVLSNFTKDDFEESIRNEGIKKIKKRFLNRLKDIKSSVPIPQLNKPIKPISTSNHELRNYEEDMKKYNLDCIKFLTKKELYKLGLLISLASENDKQNIKWAINIILEQLVCHSGTLQAVKYAVRCLMDQDDNNDLKDALSNKIMEYRISLIEEVAKKHLGNRIICISELGRSIAEYSNHMKAYLVMDLANELKVAGLYENEFRYEYDRIFVINEVKKLYKERLIQEAIELIRNDAKLSNMVRDYLERSIFKTSSYLMIEDFVHDDEYKIREDVIKALLVHFGYLK